jgi:microcystin degradation protein MlrC
MRIAIAGFVHETNTYCRDSTPKDAFHIHRGERILKNRGTDTSLGGAIETCEAMGIEPVPVFAAMAQPSGIIQRSVFDEFTDEIVTGLVDAGTIDGIILDLHGAGVVEGIDDLEGALCEAIRNTLGDVPMAATFDLHGNISTNMVNLLDGVFACQEYPHIDLHHRAKEAIELLARMASDGIKTTRSLVSLPMLMPTTTTFEGIGQETLAWILEQEKQAGIIDISWFHGFPYTDVPQVGVHVVVTTENDQALANTVAQQIAQHLWDMREQFRANSLNAEQALDVARGSNAFPVVINETSDNCGGGTPGDGTHLLRAMLEAELEDACFGFIVDPEVAAQAHKAGVGADIDISLGGKYDDLHGEPLQLNAYVKSLHDGKLKLLAMFKGTPIHYGKMARLVVNGMDIIVASNRSQTFDVAPFLALGIDVTTKKFVALKSSNHFRAGFTELAGLIVTADTPGLTTHHIEVFDRNNAAGPLWPMDETASYP